MTSYQNNIAFIVISDENNLHQGPILITDLEDQQQQHAHDVSSTTISDNDTSLDVVNVSDVQQQQQQQTPPPPPTGPTPGQAAVASMVYQLPPISTAMNFAYAPPPPELASGSPSPTSSHHSGEHPDFMQHLPVASSHAPHPPTSASSAVTAISSTPLAYNLLPAIDILRTSSGPAGSPNLWSLDHC